jgi:hypothetical protein
VDDWGIDLIGGIGTSLRSVFKRLRRLIIQAALRAVQWLHYVQHSSTASQSSKKKSSHLLKSAKLGLKIEGSEILERCAAAFESRKAAINNSSGTSCRSMASLRSAFKRLRRSRIPGISI